MNRTGPAVLAGVAPRRIVQLPGRGNMAVWEAPGPPGAPAVVLLHGATLNAELNWTSVVGTLAGHFRVIAFDQRGHGEGLRTSGFRLEECADDVAALAAELGIGRVVPVGYSIGGFVAQLVWRRHRDLVAGLVLCATARNVCGSPWERAVAMILPGVVTAATLSPACYPLGADTLGAALLDRDLDPAGRRWALAQMRRTTLLDALRAAQAGCGFTSHDWAPAIDVPTASVITVRDRVVPPRRQYKLARALADNTVVEVDADHGAFLSSPGRFAAAVLAACDAVTGGATGLGAGPGITAS
jgi:3-oxoadipate enol-lactonase